MTLLLRPDAVAARREAARGPLAPLADSLAADLEPLLARELDIPPEKARLTRAGGRCPRDGTVLEFDPFDREHHRCPRCGESFVGEEHYRWWILWYQLWLAERTVHGAALWLLRGDPRHRALADRILGEYAERYLAYPNRDNILGPTRLFFSTYLESIWLLQLCAAVSLLELTEEGAGAIGATVRERVIEPALPVIASYDESTSNRQVWTNAALIAGRLLLGDAAGAEDVVTRSSGLLAHLTGALLADGTWYEGENYHLFAHRGLWYGVTLAEAAGIALPPPLVRRFEEGFATPFLSALPDFTFPARRDSQYGISLRQWRFAELCELGLARHDDPRLLGALQMMYAPAPPDESAPAARDTGRWRSAAEVERNVPPVPLGRADLGWRSLLHARPTLPETARLAPRSALLEAQGLAVMRRDEGRVYVALDYGTSGGGHGHPDRLNLLLSDGPTRWLDDVGTGSYVDRSLHWYRSTLAHGAPLVNGASQRRVDGRLHAFDERDDVGWVSGAVAGIAPGVIVRRSVVVLEDYLVDRLWWRANEAITVDLPLHVAGEAEGLGAWADASPGGGSGVEDGFDFLEGACRADPRTSVVRLSGRRGEASADAWVHVSVPAEWWRATAPGAPGAPPEAFHFVRARGAEGAITTVWSWRGVVHDVAMDDRVHVSIGAGDVHIHREVPEGWCIQQSVAGDTRDIELGGLASGDADPAREEPGAAAETPAVMVPRCAPEPERSCDGAPARALDFTLGERHYRRSEESWEEAGRPTARIRLWVDASDLRIAVHVRKPDPVFAPRRGENPLDNENPDINSDGVQLYALVPKTGVAPDDLSHAGWLLVPEREGGLVRVSPVAGLSRGLTMRASWSAAPDGYEVRCAIPLDELLPEPGARFWLDVIVNEIAPGRERRRGQLVLSGGLGEFVYLRGDRHPVSRLLPFAVEAVP